MKTRSSRITATIRDGWIENWTLQNKRSPHYLSFIKTQDIKSRGSKSRTPDFEEPGQDRNLLSTNERHFFYRLRFSGQFVWIKEQYPLLPIERAAAIAKEIGARYPTYPYTSNVQVVMTTDFYCQTVFGKQVVYSIKDAEACAKMTPRVQANLEVKLKIERLFWESLGVKWHLIMSDSIKTPFSQNLEKIFPYHNLPIDQQILVPRWIASFKTSTSSIVSQKLHDVIEDVGNTVGVSYQDSVAMLFHCLWRKKVIANLDFKLRFENCVSEFNFQVVPHD